MQPKSSDFSSNVLISSIEESLREFWSNWGQAPQSDFYDGPDIMRLYTGVPYAFCNAVICSPFAGDDIEKSIGETVSYFNKRNTTWEWMVGPNSHPAAIEKSFKKHGLSVQGVSIGMAINLDLMPQAAPVQANLRIEEVGNDDSLQTWANTMIEGFEAPSLYPTFVNLECSLGYHQQVYRHYLAKYDLQPISTSALYLGKNVAGIYCVSTLPRARGLGAGTAITQYALREARAKGYHIAVLQSTPKGLNIYRNLGFKELSTLQSFKPNK